MQYDYANWSLNNLLIDTAVWSIFQYWTLCCKYYVISHNFCFKSFTFTEDFVFKMTFVENYDFQFIVCYLLFLLMFINNIIKINWSCTAAAVQCGKTKIYTFYFRNCYSICLSHTEIKYEPDSRHLEISDYSKPPQLHKECIQ